MDAQTNSDDKRFMLASLLASCMEAVQQRGLDIAYLEQLTGIDIRSNIQDPSGWIPVSLMVRALHNALIIIPDPLLGLHVSRPDNGATFGVLGYLTQTCSTLLEVFTLTQRYERLVSDIGATRLQHEPGITLCCWDCSSEDTVFRRHATEFLLGSWIRHIRLVRAPNDNPLLAVHFRHAAPDDPALIREVEDFFSCRVEYGQPQSALVLPASVMNLRLRTPNPSLQETLERHARLMLDQKNTEPSLVEHIRERLRVLLMQGKISRDHLADELGISSRHLHRQLQKAGSSYRELVDDLRVEMARTLLKDNSLTMEVIAQRVGFQEATSFSRWFRQMTNASPGEYRSPD